MSEWSDREADARQEGEDFLGATGGIEGGTPPPDEALERGAMDVGFGEEGGRPEPIPGEGGGGATGEESFSHDVGEQR